MLEMFLYGIAIMYSPGPVNIMALNQGLSGRLKNALPYLLGVSIAMFIWFNVFGYTGERFVKLEYLLYISIIGSIYIIYLAIKLMLAKVSIDEDAGNKSVGLKDGFLMQLLNPKAILAVIPIATIYFPANGITGINILLISLVFAVLVFGAPGSYALVGSLFNRAVKNAKVFRVFNIVMGAILLYVAFTILRDHVYLVLIGVNPY